MMKLLTSFIIVVSISFLYAQDSLIFNSKSGKIEFTVLSNEIYVEYNPRDTLKIRQIMTDSSFYIGLNSAIIHQEGLVRNFDSKKCLLIQENDINFLRIEPILLFADGTKQIAKGEINLRIKNGYHIEDVIDNYNYDFKIKSLLKTNNLYVISSDTLETKELFNILNRLNTDDRIEFAEPNFIRMAKLNTSDPYFNSQWAINNQGINGWTQGADMNVESAWNYSTGKNVKVAIIDVGVQLDHPDLQANLLPGFDAVGWGSNGGPAYIGLPNQVPPVEPPHDNYHGTACAGIVAAVANNNFGIAGVAYDAKIIPIRIGYNEDPLNSPLITTSDSWLASGIDWAWRHGADILSNSWAGGSYSNLIAEAVDSAVVRGRNGKGAIVLFSSGNESSDVAFPAYLEKVIAVGASSPCDEPKTAWSCDGESWGGNFGEGLDIIAPGVKIYTTDLTGSAGKTPNSFILDFRGTSASCPNAAAVCALILSIDTNMTGIQVRNILETTCDKVGGLNYTDVVGQPNGTWNEHAGYGRINACRAVLIAKQGGNILTNTNFTTNTLLSMDAYANGDIVVEPNVTLTITGKIQMGDNMKVIIKQGAKLVLDGGTITNAGDCGDFWQGIEVYGTSNQHQYPSNNPTYQGMLIVKNGGIIENAHIGATNWKKDDYTKIGGVIQANGGVFRNNRRDVVFMNYDIFSNLL